MTTKCDRAPKGWACRREAGHEGPCAAEWARTPNECPSCKGHRGSWGQNALTSKPEWSTCSECKGTGVSLDNVRFSTSDDSLPRPSEETRNALMEFAQAVHRKEGTKGGATPLFWHLLDTLQQHLKG